IRSRQETVCVHHRPTIFYDDLGYEFSGYSIAAAIVRLLCMLFESIVARYFPVRLSPNRTGEDFLEDQDLVSSCFFSSSSRSAGSAVDSAEGVPESVLSSTISPTITVLSSPSFGSCLAAASAACWGATAVIDRSCTCRILLAICTPI